MTTLISNETEITPTREMTSMPAIKTSGVNASTTSTENVTHTVPAVTYMINKTTAIKEETTIGSTHKVSMLISTSTIGAISTQNGGIAGGNTTITSNQEQIGESETLFGKYGLLAFGISAGLALLFLCALILLLCRLKCHKRKRKETKKKMALNEKVSDMVTPCAIYRPRPSIRDTNHCVPTPLALVPRDDPASTSSDHDPNLEVKGLLVTNLDEVAESELRPDDSDNVFSDRKSSQIDPANVSTFLLRQTSLRRSESDKRHSLPRNSIALPGLADVKDGGIN